MDKRGRDDGRLGLAADFEDAGRGGQLASQWLLGAEEGEEKDSALKP